MFVVNSGPDLDVRDRVVAFAAKAAGVQHLVKLSTLDVRTVTDGVERIICRQPISFDRWAEQNAAAFR